MKTKYDVVIAGAGPAGSTLAYELAISGIEVLLIEKYRLPRYKCCAGGLTYKTAKLLPFDISQLSEDIITDIDVTCKSGEQYHGHYNEDLIYTVDRSRFDHALAKKAVEAGADIIEGQPVININHNNSDVEVVTLQNRVRTKFVIGADGVRSIVARSAGFKNNYSYIAGINAEIQITTDELQRHKSTILVDVGCLQGGYGWIFPRSNCLAVGIATIVPMAHNLKSIFQKFITTLSLGQYHVIRQRGGLIPVVNGDPGVAQKRIALIGDAAGLADPLSGEGIYNAIISARLAAGAIKNCLSKNLSDLTEYQTAINEVLMPEIRIARILQKIFIHFPEVTVKLLQFDELVWRGCCYYARGDIDYATAKQKIGGFEGVRKILKKVIVS